MLGAPIPAVSHHPAMCLIALAWQCHPRYPLILATNRDEFHDRPAEPFAPWRDAPDVVGGRDGLHGGSWLALRGRRLAAVTNVRRPGDREGRSRGELVADFARGSASALDALQALADDAPRYRPFNLLVHDGELLAFATNMPRVPGEGEDGRSFALRTLAPGFHGISNGPLDAPWPKTERMIAQLEGWLDSPGPRAATPDLEPLFAALADTSAAHDDALPDTGVGIHMERFLSPAFIRSERYGTRASTIVLVGEDHARVVERRFAPDGACAGESHWRSDAFRSASAPA